jgi:hypothetical protein
MKQVIIRKTDTADVRVTRDSYKGRQTIDIRVWYRPKSGEEFVPSGKGVTLDAGKLDELLGALQAVSE